MGLFRLNASLKVYYQQYNVVARLEITLKLLAAEKLDEFPCLAGPGVKGATIRAMVPWAARCLRAHPKWSQGKQ